MSLLNAHKKSMKLMGNHFEITAVGLTEKWAHEKIDLAVREIQRIESLLTTYHPDSETNLINAQAGMAPVKVSAEILQLIERSIRISSVTQGAFDISYGSVDNSLWNFDTTMTQLPDPAIAKQRVRLINYKNIVINKEASTVYLREKGMRIGFGGIGKGYAAEMAKKVMIEAGVESGVVNASGDLTTWGTQPNGEKWMIDIKTSKSLHTSQELQLAAYSQAWNENFEEKIERAGILWLKSAKHGPDKNNKKIQGKGWELAESERSIEDNLTLFHSIHNLFKLENPNPRPSSEQYPTEIQIGV